jgi:hypothetical protein
MEQDKTTPAQTLNEAKDKLGDARAEATCVGFHESIRDLPAREQASRIAAKLTEIHGGAVNPRVTIEDGIITGMDLGDSRSSKIGIRWLQPLRGLKLTTLYWWGSGVADLSPLKGMPLTELHIPVTGVGDLKPLAGMRLNILSISGCPGVADLNPLDEMPLRELFMVGCPKICDLSPLEGMKLEVISFTPKHIKKGLDILRRMKSLRGISTRLGVPWDSGPLMPPEEFWRRCDAGEFSE